MQHRKTLMLVLTALFAALTAIGAFFKIPFALAAISLQFLFTAMAGILLGAGYGALSQGVYVLIGLVGVPIFALGGGFSYVLQPTFGFLLGLIPSAYVIGKLAKRPLTFWETALAMLAGLAVLYAIGVPYMALIANAYLGKGLTFWQVIKNGMLIYLPGDLLKIALGSFCASPSGGCRRSSPRPDLRFSFIESHFLPLVNLLHQRFLLKAPKQAYPVSCIFPNCALTDTRQTGTM